MEGSKTDLISWEKTIKKIKNQVLDLMFEIFYNDKLMNEISKLSGKIDDKQHHELLNEAHDLAHRIFSKYMMILDSVQKI
ncbi:MAG: hypothetical protein ACTSVI_00945 [Promethearchaeota archaeon]